MIIKSPSTLNRFSGPGKCEICGQWRKKRHPHHAYKRGFGGGTRLDVPENLVATGDAFECPCHRDADEYRIPRERVLEIIARREGYPSGEAVTVFIFWLRELPKDSPKEVIEAKRLELKGLRKAG